MRALLLRIETVSREVRGCGLDRLPLASAALGLLTYIAQLSTRHISVTTSLSLRPVCMS
jgi:hypothetical protein